MVQDALSEAAQRAADDGQAGGSRSGVRGLGHHERNNGREQACRDASRCKPRSRSDDSARPPLGNATDRRLQQQRNVRRPRAPTRAACLAESLRTWLPSVCSH